MKRILSLLVVLAMVIAMVPNVSAAEANIDFESLVSRSKPDIDFDDLINLAKPIDTIDQIDVTAVEGIVTKIFKWTPDEAGVLSVLFYESDLPEGTTLDITLAQGDNRITYSELEDDAAFELAVEAGEAVSIIVVKSGAAVENFPLYGSLMPPAGSEENPIFLELEWNEEYTAATATVTAPVGTTYYAANNVAGMVLTVNGEESGVLTGMPRMPVIIPITNDGEAAAEYVLTFTFPAGTQMNPAQLVLGENTAEIAEGNNQGYFYTWTAEADGDLTITMPEGNWFYVLNNLTTYTYGDSQWSDSDPVVNPATISVKAGDEIQLIVNTYDPSSYANPAGTLVVTAEFTAPAGSEENPIFLELEWNEEYTAATATVTAPVGTTYYAAHNVAGMMLTVNGEDAGVLTGMPRMPVIIPITNDGEAAAEYVLTFTFPAGTQMNPAQLVLGENTAEIAEGNNQGYFYTWTAEADGDLTITMPEGNWFYVLNNLTTYTYGDSQWSDSDPVVNPATISVKAGDEIQLIVNTYDPSSYANPAGTLVVTAEFKAAGGEEPTYTPGDVNGDDNINSLDGLMLMRYLNGWDVEVSDAMDVNADGTVNSLDGLVLMRYLNGWEIELG